MLDNTWGNLEDAPARLEKDDVYVTNARDKLEQLNVLRGLSATIKSVLQASMKEDPSFLRTIHVRYALKGCREANIRGCGGLRG